MPFHTNTKCNRIQVPGGTISHACASYEASKCGVTDDSPMDEMPPYNLSRAATCVSVNRFISCKSSTTSLCSPRDRLSYLITACGVGNARLIYSLSVELWGVDNGGS